MKEIQIDIFSLNLCLKHWPCRLEKNCKLQMLVSEIGASEKFGCEMDRVSSDEILMIAQYCFRNSDEGTMLSQVYQGR